MEKREFKNKRRYLSAFAIGTFLFILVFLLSYSISFLEFQRVANLQTNLAYDIFEHKLTYTFFDEGFCGEADLNKISDDLGFQGSIIDDLERKLGKNNEDVLERKKFYTLVEIEHYEFVKMMNEDCNSQIPVIMFFYSNEDSDLTRSEEVGRLISAVASRQNVLMVYSFDINLDSALIENLKEKYNVSESPTLIVNEEFVVVNPLNINDIEVYLN